MLVMASKFDMRIATIILILCTSYHISAPYISVILCMYEELYHIDTLHISKSLIIKSV